MHIKVLGTGCANCQTTYQRIAAAAQAQGVDIQLEKIEDLATIMQYAVMSTPAVVIDEQVVHAGGIPSSSAITAWLSNTNAGCCSGSADKPCC